MVKTIFYLLVLGLCLIHAAYSQTKIHGVLVDSTYNNVLRSATVSIYEKGKKSVDKVTLTDNFGKFVLEELSPEKILLIELSYQGFQKLTKEFTLKKGEHLDMGHINMKLALNEIEAIDIIPPIRMNGDTLEFNADAFELDSNAVVEDLLHKLPGLVVWGDGAVTYNGRDIPNLLVNGKSFFGTEKAIILQNIDKKAVNKIQIYDTREKKEQKENPEDQKYEMNVVLKEGKEKMYFGFAGIGLGNKDRYETSANFNYSTNRTQASIAYSTNNVNKDLTGIDQLLKNTTYKGIDVNADFDSDFLRSGILNQHVLGGRYQYDIIGANDVSKRHLFNTNVLSTWNRNNIKNESNTQLLNVDNASNTRSHISDAENSRRSQHLSTNYQNSVSKWKGREINLMANLNATNTHNSNISSSESKYDYENIKSTNTLNNDENNNVQTISLMTHLDIFSKAGKYMVVRGDHKYSYLDQVNYNLKLNANVSKTANEQLRQGDYTNLTNTNLNKNYLRSYDENMSSKNFNLDLNASRMGLEIGSNIRYYSTTTDNLVNDQIVNTPTENKDLSHVSNFSLWQYEPRISYRYNIKSKNLYGRMSSNLSLNLKLAARLYRDDNRSNLDYRNLALSYTSILPEASLNYNYNKNNQFFWPVSISYNFNEEYPLLDRMRPIYDDINPAYRYYGSTTLLEKTGIHSFGLNTSYRQSRQNGYDISYYFNYKSYQNGLTDSIVYAENQQQAYLAQIRKPMGLYSMNIAIKKPFLIGKNQTLSLNLNSRTSWGNKFQYIGTELQEMVNNNQNIDLNTYYTVLNKYQLGWINSWTRYERKDKSNTTGNNDYRSYSWNTGLSMAYAVTKRWSLNSNATVRYNTSTYNSDHAIIWNANTTYRVLKDNSLEFKVAAYDLLRQNKGLYYTNGLTEFTTGYRNILTQYYMLSISYFPRKFGLK
ncbi:CarboxypepD_reg-like domain-containing protein [Sphingobacterium nematocida]|uniref:CarboxypepD_reg-like domain-containing protein n=1 Tax=Sphingobacterium nematocida TaxID=1513896 RepID=A0A1T5DKC1_9SPHI|nr:carboxypeptidase regulatory-like domain-containing protein [Sphingobacterium nematocida]SKB72145.1 CarboxypepD_reg-like domain-containing protein [Sphingobacterium nematocida]